MLNQKKGVALPSDIVQNWKNDALCMAITTRRGKIFPRLCLWIATHVDDVELEEDLNDEPLVVSKYLGDLERKRGKLEYTSMPRPVSDVEENKGKEVEDTPWRIPIPPPPVSYILKNKADKGKFSKFMDMIKYFSVNMPLVKTLMKMLGYYNIMNGLVMKKRTISYEPMDNLHHCSAIMTRSLV